MNLDNIELNFAQAKIIREVIDEHISQELGQYEITTFTKK